MQRVSCAISPHAEGSGKQHGLRPCTADGLPAIGQVPGTDNAYVATGHAMMGVTLGPGTAELVADCMEAKPLPDWARPMDTARFA